MNLIFRYFFNLVDFLNWINLLHSLIDDMHINLNEHKSILQYRIEENIEEINLCCDRTFLKN